MAWLSHRGELTRDGGTANGHLHFHDALWQVGRDLCQSLPSAVHDVITACARRRAGQGVGIAGRSLRVGTWEART